MSTSFYLLSFKELSAIPVTHLLSAWIGFGGYECPRLQGIVQMPLASFVLWKSALPLDLTVKERMVHIMEEIT